MIKGAIRLVAFSLITIGLIGHVLAEDVFITRTGKFYYAPSSPFIKTRAMLRMSREEAEGKGYRPSKSYLKEKEKESRITAASSQQ